MHTHKGRGKEVVLRGRRGLGVEDGGVIDHGAAQSTVRAPCGAVRRAVSVPTGHNERTAAHGSSVLAMTLAMTPMACRSETSWAARACPRTDSLRTQRGPLTFVDAHGVPLLPTITPMPMGLETICAAILDVGVLFACEDFACVAASFPPTIPGNARVLSARCDAAAGLVAVEGRAAGEGTKTLFGRQSCGRFGRRRAVPSRFSSWR